MPKPKPKSRKKKPPKGVLALPDLEHAKTAVLNSLTSPGRPIQPFSSGSRSPTGDGICRESWSSNSDAQEVLT